MGSQKKVVKNPLFWLATILGLLGDRITKDIVIETFTIGQTTPLWPGVFHLTYVVNTGAAFSLFRGHGEGWLRWLSIVVSAGLMLLAFLHPLSRWQQVGYGFILAGAFGNGVDRLATGAVVDFFDFRLITFPVFNVADISINIGIISLLIGILTETEMDQTRDRDRNH